MELLSMVSKTQELIFKLPIKSRPDVAVSQTSFERVSITLRHRLRVRHQCVVVRVSVGRGNILCSLHAPEGDWDALAAQSTCDFASQISWPVKSGLVSSHCGGPGVETLGQL